MRGIRRKGVIKNAIKRNKEQRKKCQKERNARQTVDWGTVRDFVVEAFAGPHDYLNSWISYDTNPGSSNFGNIRSDPPVPSLVGEVLNGANVVVAAPVVLFSLLPTR